MAWQIVAIWAVVMVTITWFVRDERRLIANASLAQARFLYGPPHYTAPVPEAAAASATAAAPGRPIRELGRDGRAFLEALSDGQ
tara:strand:+ start:1228 stop:1479 length:252 start_codon:yes stop_codon:yes gene_type:complete